MGLTKVEKKRVLQALLELVNKYEDRATKTDDFHLHVRLTGQADKDMALYRKLKAEWRL